MINSPCHLARRKEKSSKDCILDIPTFRDWEGEEEPVKETDEEWLARLGGKLRESPRNQEKNAPGEREGLTVSMLQLEGVK